VIDITLDEVKILAAKIQANDFDGLWLDRKMLGVYKEVMDFFSEPGKPEDMEELVNANDIVYYIHFRDGSIKSICVSSLKALSYDERTLRPTHGKLSPPAKEE
jgi:hypothetical protein